MISGLYSSETEYMHNRNAVIYEAARKLIELSESDPCKKTRTPAEQQEYDAELFRLWRESYYELEIRYAEKRCLVLTEH